MKKEYWQSVDWTKNDTEIAIDSGQAIANVSYWRKRVGSRSPNRYKHIRKDGKHAVTIQRLAEIDFTKWHDRDIAEKYGITRERARQLRILAGAKTIGKAPRRATLAALEIIKEYGRKLDGIKASDVKERFKLKLSASKLSLLLRQAGISKATTAKINPWHLVNWNLPNKLLAEIWMDGQNNGTIRVAQQRKVKKKGLAKWDGRGPTQAPKWIVDRERKKAFIWFKSWL